MEVRAADNPEVYLLHCCGRGSGAARTPFGERAQAAACGQALQPSTPHSYFYDIAYGLPRYNPRRFGGE